MVSPLVLLAGMNCTADLWADARFDGALRPVLDRPAIADQVSVLLADLPETSVLVGHSLGGIVGMALAAAAPERVAGLCLVSTNAKAPTDSQRDGWREWLTALDRGVQPRALQNSILEQMLGERTTRDRPDLAQRVLRMGDETGAERLRAQLRMQLTRTDLLSRISGLAMPILVVSGRDDVICPPSFHAEIVSTVHNARLVTLEGGHMLPLQRGADFGDLLRSWCAGYRLNAAPA